MSPFSPDPPPEPRISGSVSTLSRRRFLALTGAAGAALLAPRPPAMAAGDLVAEEPWGRLVRLADGVWAVESTPMRASDWTTGCNGGLIAGDERVLAVESFLRPEGAAWLAGHAERLTGRRPTDVLVTHYHGDHSSGLAGYARDAEAPRLWVTATTRDLIREGDAGRGAPDAARTAMLDGAELLDAGSSVDLDLGGRAVTLHARRGHTASDVTAEIAEPSVVYFGDLLWNGFFPNYRDTVPTAFAESIRAARRERETLSVPGHGALADDRALSGCLTLVDAVEEAGRTSFETGTPPAEAAAAFRLPEEVSDWVLFNERYFEVAIAAWHRELDGASAGG